MSAITEKYRRVAELSEDYRIDSLLDVGCRDAALKAWVPRVRRYVGIDLSRSGNPGVDVVCDVTAGLPVPDGSFEAVVALDLLEHLDDLTAFLGEIERVSTRLMIVALPNLAHAAFRWNFLLKGRLSGKYDLKYGYGKDRHRWLTVVPQTDAFIDAFASDRGYTVKRFDLRSGSRRHRLVEAVLRAVGFGRAWYVWRTLYVIEKPMVR
jgi:hypothetical protein